MKGEPMSNTTILEENYDRFDVDTGEIKEYTKRTVKKTRIEPTDEFIKVSKYLNTIFAYNQIPLNLVGISLLLAQRMEFKTNILYLLKSDKEELAQMLGVSTDRVKALLKDCKTYDIIRPTNTRGKYEVNSYLFSTGSIVETRKLQAHFDFDTDTFMVQAEQKNLITGTTVRKAVANRKDKQIPGQLSLFDFHDGE